MFSPRIDQTLDRWGNVIEVNDVRSTLWKTTYRYNANNQVIREKRPNSEARWDWARSRITSTTVWIAKQE